MNTNPDEGDLLLRLSGIVPMDDFQPFIAHVARRLHLRGWISCDARGPVIRAIGVEDQLVGLVHAILHDAPPSLRIRSLEVEPVAENLVPVGEQFAVLPSATIEFIPPAPEPAIASRVA
jgi:hydrogenase maturation factor HypF (carbamoyltransferase family)